jgi:hypothetical protein
VATCGNQRTTEAWPTTRIFVQIRVGFLEDFGDFGVILEDFGDFGVILDFFLEVLLVCDGFLVFLVEKFD